MKLISVKILGDTFRSLASNKLYKFNESQHKARLSPKIFAGLNGSGKSNFLELLAEIFFYLEVFHSNSVKPEYKKSKDFGFEIEYMLPMVHPSPIGLLDFKNSIEFNMHVRIVKELGQYPEFSRKKFGEEHFERIDKLTQYLLPTKVIAYTSGQNELLSNPFLKIRYHYFKATENINVASEGKEDEFENQRLFFLDSSSNFSIFVSNMLLANPDKLKYLTDIFKVEDLHSFRITINLVNYRKVKISLSENIKNHILKLKLCSTSWIERKKGKEEFLLLDYRVNAATHEAFKYHFKTSFELFKAFYDLENLNLNLVPVDTRSLILKAHKSLNLSDELPKPDPSRLIFRIEKINLNKIVEDGKPSKTIYYKGLSDGEHQFNEVIGSVLMMEQDGCLFLMDEPDTHFNPLWRAKMIEMLNHVAAYKFDSKGKPEAVRKQEIIITTHSPFVISDSQTDDVYKFDKVKGEVVYINPKIETYGASVSLLLQEIFDRRISISDLSNYDLEELREELKELKKPKVIKAKIDEIREKLVDFGESIEKFDLYSLLSQIETDVDRHAVKKTIKPTRKKIIPKKGRKSIAKKSSKKKKKK
ncbi:MAG: restriction system-associated AAA family ATPase [Bacteroidia bacterium]